MDRQAWPATVHGVTESDKTERLTLWLSRMLCLHLLSFPINGEWASMGLPRPIHLGE